jgi:hypothetical protein
MALTDSEQMVSVQGATVFVPPSASGSFQSSGRQTLVLGLLLFVASLALYSPVGRHPFVNYDDDRYVSDNAHVRDGFSWESVKWAFTSYDESNWHPVTWLWTSLHQRRAARSKRGPVVLDSLQRNSLGLAKLNGRRDLCAAPHQR